MVHWLPGRVWVIIGYRLVMKEVISVYRVYVYLYNVHMHVHMYIVLR